MVNTGRPSGACGVCRERRIKCDETKPACMKCNRSGRSCSGYSHGLKLRDQTQQTIIKAKLSKPRGRRQGNVGQELVKRPGRSVKKAPSVCSSEDNEIHQQHARSRSLSLPSRAVHGRTDSGCRGHKRSLSNPVERTADYGSLDALVKEATMDSSLWQTINIPLVEQARCYFLSSYVVYGPKNDLGMFTFIPYVLTSSEPVKTHFEDLFTAVSLAAFSLRGNAPHAAASARWYYGKGLAELRKVLGDNELAKSDTALASTILLGFYEGLNNDEAANSSYKTHFEGAVTLLRLRGDEQFATSHGTEMFLFVMQVLMRQYTLSIAVTEEDLCRWTMQAAKHAGAADQPHLTTMWVGDLRLKVARLIESGDRSPAGVQTAMKFLSSAQKFEWLVSQRFEAENAEVLYTQTQGQTSAEAATSTTEVHYTDWWSATMSLNQHALRLLLCHIIADISDWLNEGTGLFQGSRTRAANTAQEDIQAIIASLPYLCDRNAEEYRDAPSPCGRDDLSSVKGITSHVVLWPLYLAGESRFATETQKKHMRSRLGWIAANMGSKHASGISEQLKLAANGSSPRPSPRSKPYMKFGIEEDVNRDIVMVV